MLLTVKKQVEETVEVKTPAYYRDYIGSHHYINESGVLISVRTKSINTWLPEDGKFYNEEIAGLIKDAMPCTREEFEAHYMEVMGRIESAVGAGINS